MLDIEVDIDAVLGTNTGALTARAERGPVTGESDRDLEDALLEVEWK